MLLATIHLDGMQQVYQDYQLPSNAILFATVVIFGSVFEGIGTNIEVRWDKEREQEFEVKENWYKYLSQKSTPDRVGHRYISRLVTTMYFELCMAIAAPAMLIGLTALLFTSNWHLRYWIGPVVTALACAAHRFFKSHARDSHKVLCLARQQLARRIDQETTDD